jgi:hypothetical protein
VRLSFRDVRRFLGSRLKSRVRTAGIDSAPRMQARRLPPISQTGRTLFRRGLEVESDRLFARIVLR